MRKSYLDLDECLRAGIQGKEVAWLLLELERIDKIAAERNIRIERRNDGLVLQSTSGSFPSLSLGRITNSSQGHYEVEASAMLYGPGVRDSDHERDLFEAAFCKQMGWQRQSYPDEFSRHPQTPTEYKRRATERAWEAWVHGFWWAWCQYNPVPEPSIESNIGAAELELDADGDQPGAEAPPAPEPKLEDDLPWRQPFRSKPDVSA